MKEDWITDNISSLREEFIEMHQDKFDEFCADKYNEEGRHGYKGTLPI